MVKLNIRFASKDEGRDLIRHNTQYYGRLSQTDIDWRARKEDATLDELIAFAQDQVLDFTPDEIHLVESSVSFMEFQFNHLKCSIPVPQEIVFVKSTLKDESEAWAYTTGNQIFLNVRLLEHFLPKPSEKIPFEKCMRFTVIIAHELFHCITRHSPKFRQQMYGLIGFTVMDHEIEFPEKVRNAIMANPDVEHIDNYAEFNINGVRRKCVLLSLYTDSWAGAYAKQGDSARFFANNQAYLMALDDLHTPIDIDDAVDFWDKIGQNTEYVTAPEECLADNFSYAVVLGPERNYGSPWLIEAIYDTLTNFKE